MKQFLLFLLGVLFVSAHIDTSGCGKVKECVFVPPECQSDSSKCRYVFSYSPQDDEWTNMELYTSSDSPRNNYVAVGFSSDDVMGDDYVSHCAFVDGSEPKAQLTYNFGKSNAPPSETNDQKGATEHIELVHAHKNEEGLYCSFKQKSVQNQSQFLPKLDEDKVIFLVRGNARQPAVLDIHSLDPNSPDFPFISDHRVNVGKRSPAMAAPEPQPSPPPTGGLSMQTRFLLVRIHAILMTIGWLSFVVLAVLSARYLRDHFLSSAPFGLKWWFHLHRTFNFIALALVVVAGFLIFIAKDWSWRGPSVNSDFSTNTSPSSFHTVLGCIAIGTIIIQPLMAFIRCAPDTGARPIFNWTHRILGIIGVICAIIAIAIGANAFSSLWSDSNWALAIVLFYVVILLVVIILFEVLSYMKMKPSRKTTDMELRHRQKYDDRGHVISGPKVIDRKSLHLITVVYAVFALFAVAVTTGLVIMLII